MSNLLGGASRIDEFLYLSGVHSAVNVKFLEQVSIKGIVNTTVDEVNLDPNHYEYLRISIDDSRRERLTPFFPIVFQFIERHRQASQAVLVHCQMGISRSPSFVIGYLMMRDKRTAQEAFNFVKSIRPHIDPNPGFRRDLCELEQSLFGQITSVQFCPIASREFDEDQTVDTIIHLFLSVASSSASFAPDVDRLMLHEKLCHLIEDQTVKNVLVILEKSVLISFEEFGADNPREARARLGVKQELVQLCQLKQIQMADLIVQIRSNPLLKDFSIDVPHVQRWLNELEQ